MSEQTLTDALKVRGIRHEKSEIEGKRDLFDANTGHHFGSFDAQEAWDWLRNNHPNRPLSRG